jgi:cytochrome oxidase Cu insertion factor (SCO1/SenC/PrrC family)
MPFLLTFPPSSTVTLRMARVLRITLDPEGDTPITLKSQSSEITLRK